MCTRAFVRSRLIGTVIHLTLPMNPRKSRVLNAHIISFFSESVEACAEYANRLAVPNFTGLVRIVFGMYECCSGLRAFCVCLDV